MRVQMRTEITKLHQRLQATMIYVTHDQIEAMTMGDRIVVMNDGVVQQNDAPLTLYNEPANLFVAGFLGSPPMNFIHGTLKQQGDKVRFIEKEGGTIEATFSAEERPAARAFVGKAVILGIRPEDLEAKNLADNNARVTRRRYSPPSWRSSSRWARRRIFISRPAPTRSSAEPRARSIIARRGTAFSSK